MDRNSVNGDENIVLDKAALGSHGVLRNSGQGQIGFTGALVLIGHDRRVFQYRFPVVQMLHVLRAHVVVIGLKFHRLIGRL